VRRSPEHPAVQFLINCQSWSSHYQEFDFLLGLVAHHERDEAGTTDAPALKAVLGSDCRDPFPRMFRWTPNAWVLMSFAI
tara:strand:- start:4074 stop:4313 length:240 start_codon:yes stop_codon:yes gene_type:complete